MRYRTIVADPPWDHSDGTGAVFTVGCGDVGVYQTRRQRDDNGYVTGIPYTVLSVTQIKALPVAEQLAETDAHLYLWTTNRYLRHVWDVAEAWGFRGVATLTWCKRPSGWMPGGAWPSNTEFCLFATRGNCPSIGKATGRWFEFPRTRGPWVKTGERRQAGHSAKPEAFLDMVETVSPGPYLEMFARRQRLGWHTWGNEALEHVTLQ